LNDPPPEELTHRALAAARRQVTRYPRKSRTHVHAWIAPILVVSVAWIVLAGCFWAAEHNLHKLAKLPWLTEYRHDTAAAVVDQKPTAWTYAQAARQSPEALYSLLDRQSYRTIAAGSPLLASTGITPLVSLHNSVP
jgi:hypothetical protein